MGTGRTVIGITLDHEGPGGYAQAPWYALRQNYADAVAAFGAVPLMLPYHAEFAEDYLAMIDGLVVAGGNFDIDPAVFGESARHETVTTKPARTAFEWAVLEGALKRRMPVLGVCGGEQLLNVVLGGTLIQHIPDAIENALEHEQKAPKHEPTHEVEVTPGSLLHRLTGKNRFMTNTTHHQAVKTPGKGVTVSARAKDGVIEAIEAPEYGFCLGAQWHPEYLVTEEDRAIFKGFVEACGERVKQRAV